MTSSGRRARAGYWFVAPATLVLLLVLGSALFVSAEYALITARRVRLEEKAAGGRRGAKTALRAFCPAMTDMAVKEKHHPRLSYGFSGHSTFALAAVFGATVTSLPPRF